MITLHVDLGQILIGTLIGLVGWFIKKEIVNLNARLNKHEDIIIDITAAINKMAGEMGVLIRLGEGSVFLHKRASDTND